MTISFKEYQQLRDQLSDDKLAWIARELGISVSKVRDYFSVSEVEQRADGEVVVLEDSSILEMAKSTLKSLDSNPDSEKQMIYQRSDLKQMVKTVLREEPELLKSLIREILEENKIIGPNTNEERKQRIEAFISEEFDRYDDVFQALA